MEIHFILYTSHDHVLVLCKPHHPFPGQHGVGKERLQCQKVETGGLSLPSQLCSWMIWPANRQGIRSVQHQGCWGFKSVLNSQNWGHVFIERCLWHWALTSSHFCPLDLYFCEWSCPSSCWSIEILKVGSSFDAQKRRPAVVRVMYTIPSPVVGIRFRNTITSSTSPLMTELKRHFCGSLCATEDFILSYVALWYMNARN